MDAKFDAPLRLKIHELEQSGSRDSLDCFIRLDGYPAAEKQAALRKAGLRILTTLRTIITVRGTSGALRRAASHDFVKQISLSQTRPLNHTGP